MLDVLDLAVAGAQDVIDHRPVLQRRLLLKITHASHKVKDRLMWAVVSVSLAALGVGRAPSSSLSGVFHRPV